MSTRRKIEQVLNITGLLEPQSIFLVRNTLERINQGGTLEIVSEKNSMDIPNGLCSGKKYIIFDKKEIHGLFHYKIKKT